MVDFHVVPSCDTVGFGLVLIDVFAGIFKLSALFLRYRHGLCCSRVFLLTLHGSSAWYLVTLTITFTVYIEVITRSFENSPGPHEAEGLHPTHGRHGVGGGLARATGASDGSVRTRLCPTFQSVPFCQVVCLLITRVGIK